MPTKTAVRAALNNGASRKAWRLSKRLSSAEGKRSGTSVQAKSPPDKFHG
jgi:hypothetical protein